MNLTKLELDWKSRGRLKEFQTLVKRKEELDDIKNSIFESRIELFEKMNLTDLDEQRNLVDLILNVVHEKDVSFQSSKTDLELCLTPKLLKMISPIGYYLDRLKKWIYKNMNKIKTDIPDSPFDGGKEWDVEVDTEKGFDDEDEQLTDEEIDMLINYQFEGLQWDEDEKKFEDIMKIGHPHTQRGFYCYVISQMNEEQLTPYIKQYVGWLERMNYKNELNKLPTEVKEDEEVMDLRKKQIEDDGRRIGNQVVEDLMSYLNKWIRTMKLIDLIKQSLHDKRKQGKTSGMWLYVGIPHMVKMGNKKDLYDWEKKWFDSKVGIRWDKKGNRLKN